MMGSRFTFQILGWCFGLNCLVHHRGADSERVLKKLESGFGCLSCQVVAFAASGKFLHAFFYRSLLLSAFGREWPVYFFLSPKVFWQAPDKSSNGLWTRFVVKPTSC
jgi:hypothetical protein